MTKVKTVYDHIKANNLKTAALVALFPIIFIVLVFLFVWIVAPLQTALDTTMKVAIPVFVAGLLWMLISWAFGDSMMLSSSGAKEVHPDEKEYKQVFKSVENIALAAGLPTPRVYIIEDESLNAFATGRSPQDASVALTRGIINRLDKAELEGVIAHELAHIGNRDIRLDMLVITGVGVTVFAADIILRMALGSSSDKDSKDNTAAILFAVWGAFMVFNFLITPLLRMAISRKREFAADATGAFITRNPGALASALKKISTDPRVEVMDKTKSMASVFIENPLGGHKAFFGEMFSTHPKTEERIKRLESM